MRSCNDIDMVVKLNVGGVEYTTTRSTLLAYPDSLLSSLVLNADAASALNEKVCSRLLIDRDGSLFRFVLNFLRDKRLHLPDTFAEYAQLRQEAEFYRLASMAALVDARQRLVVANRNLGPSAKSPPRSIYFTIVSKLHQGTLTSFIGCLSLVDVFAPLDLASKRFVHSLLATGTDTTTTTTSTTNTSSHGSFVCECQFLVNESLICCKPCGFANSSDPHTAQQGRAILRLARRNSIEASYWGDTFYLRTSVAAPSDNSTCNSNSANSCVSHRERVCGLLTDKCGARLLSTCIGEAPSSSSPDSDDFEADKGSLIERWVVHFD